MNATQIKKTAMRRKIENIPFYLDEKAVKGLIERTAGKVYASAFQIEQMPSENGYDAYELFCREEKIVIKATSGVAAARGYDEYLRKVCGYTIGFINTTGKLPDLPPQFDGVMKNESVFHYRYLFNFCTFAYSYAFTGWDEWEQILDRVLLSGYNLVLNPIGHETVWKKLLEKYGYTKEEVERFLVNPAFLPFLWMMNMSDYEGKYPDWWFESRAELSRKFNARLESFGAGVMLPGYCGMVPDDFKQHFPLSKPLDQGFWNGYPRPSYILPDDVMFSEMADSFYEIQKETVNGQNAHYYSVDPFHEGGLSDGIDLGAFSEKIMEKMLQHDEKAVWFFQGWQQNPKREMLKALDKGHVLVGNLLADTNGESGDNFANSPWIYCNVNNFGGQHVLRGNAVRTLTKPFEFAEKESCTMVGYGYMPEAVENDEIFFDILAKISVEKNKLDFSQYIPTFLKDRYGKTDEKLEKAWYVLAEKIYTEDNSVYEGESVFLARPSLEVDRASMWGRGCRKEAFPSSCLLSVCEDLFSEYCDLSTRSAYRFDLTDIVRQCITEAGWYFEDKIIKAYLAKDKTAFAQNTEIFLKLFDLQIDVVSSDEHFLLGKWLERAKGLGRDAYEKRWFEHYARVQITTWSDERSPYFHEYAAKEWQGMMEDFYRPRWERFISMLELSLYTDKPLKEYANYDREIMFSYERKTYPKMPIRDLKESVFAALEYLKILKSSGKKQ